MCRLYSQGALPCQQISQAWKRVFNDCIGRASVLILLLVCPVLLLTHWHLGMTLEKEEIKCVSYQTNAQAHLNLNYQQQQQNEKCRHKTSTGGAWKLRQNLAMLPGGFSSRWTSASQPKAFRSMWPSWTGQSDCEGLEVVAASGTQYPVQVRKKCVRDHSLK